MYKDLLWSSPAAEVLHQRVGLVRRAEAARNPGGAEKPAERLGIELAGHDRNANPFIHRLSLPCRRGDQACADGRRATNDGPVTIILETHAA